jgi:hypothetical protein
MSKHSGSLHSNVLDCKQTTVELRTFVGLDIDLPPEN